MASSYPRSDQFLPNQCNEVKGGNLGKKFSSVFDREKSVIIDMAQFLNEISIKDI